MRNFKGERYVYRQPKGPAQPRRHMSEPEISASSIVIP
jgi:hypothetical protein